jgi:hypothetical protein
MRFLIFFLALGSVLAADDLTVLDPASKPAEAFEQWLTREFVAMTERRSEAFEKMIKSEAAMPSVAGGAEGVFPRTHRRAAGAHAFESADHRHAEGEGLSRGEDHAGDAVCDFI